jgi:Flp pilus assembly pilin Flp
MKFQRGVTSIEYALIAFLIAIAIIVGVGATGVANAVNWNKVSAALTKVLSP